MAGLAPRSMICRRRSPRRRLVSISSSTRIGSPAWRSAFACRSRIMPANNRKQAMLPAWRRAPRQPDRHRLRLRARHRPGAVLLHAGRAARAVPHARRQVVPRLLAARRPHRGDLPEALPFLWARRIACRCALEGGRGAGARGAVKLGFRAHYPQLETKLAVRGRDQDEVRRLLAPVEAEVRQRLGNFILAEDDETLEGNILARAAPPERHACRRRDLHRRTDRRPDRALAWRRNRVPRAASSRATASSPRPACGLRWRPRRPARTRGARATRREPRLAVLVDARRRRRQVRVRRHDLACDRVRSGRRDARARASSAGATGSGSARSRWGSIACAATCSACRSTSASISRRCDRA